MILVVLYMARANTNSGSRAHALRHRAQLQREFGGVVYPRPIEEMVYVCVYDVETRSVRSAVWRSMRGSVCELHSRLMSATEAVSVAVTGPLVT